MCRNEWWECIGLPASPALSRPIRGKDAKAWSLAEMSYHESSRDCYQHWWRAASPQAWGLLQVPGGLFKLGLNDEELMSEGATVESRVGGQGQVTGRAARGRVRSGEGWCAVHGDAMLSTRRFLWASHGLHRVSWLTCVEHTCELSLCHRVQDAHPALECLRSSQPQGHTTCGKDYFGLL